MLRNQFELNRNALSERIRGQDLRLQAFPHYAADADDVMRAIAMQNEFSGRAAGVFQGCQFGQIYDEAQKACLFCSQGTYSFGQSQTSCSECPAKFICPGQYLPIGIEQGFYSLSFETF